MAKLDNRIPIFPGDTRDVNLSSAIGQTMRKIYGIPGEPDSNCCEHLSRPKKRSIKGLLSGKFSVQGLDIVVESLQEILAEVALELPEVHTVVKNDGTLCVPTAELGRGHNLQMDYGPRFTMLRTQDAFHIRE
jgi:hypothetical protein